MKHIVQFSGGAASAYVAWLVAHEHGSENTVLLFHDTKTEHEDNTRFRKQVSEYVGVPITEVSDGRDLWQLIDDEHCLPSSFIPFCTRILKAEQGEKYLKELDESFILYNGLGVDEWRRVQRATARAASLGRQLCCPLVDLRITDAEVKRIIREEWKICLPSAYKTIEHANCIPCFKAGKGHWFRVWKYHREAFDKAVGYEAKIGHTVFKGEPLKDLAAKWEAEPETGDLGLDTMPCMCAE